MSAAKRGLRSLAVSRTLLEPQQPSSSSPICLFCRLYHQTATRDLPRPSKRSKSAPTKSSQIPVDDVEKVSAARRAARQAVEDEAAPSENLASAEQEQVDPPNELANLSRQPEFEYDIVPQEEGREEMVAPPTERRPPRQHQKREERLQARRERLQIEKEEQQEELLRLREELDAGSSYTDYIPATSSEGLPILGGTVEKDEVGDFKPFVRPDVSADKRVEAETRSASHLIMERQVYTTAAVYRAIVESYAALAVGRNPVPSHAYKSKALFNETRNVAVSVTKKGDPEGEGATRLKFPDEQAESQVLRSSGWYAKHPPPNDFQSTYEEAEAIVKSWGRQWLHVSLEDPRVKFAVMKRVKYLTGRTIPDHVIDKSNTAFILLTNIARIKAATTVHQAVTRTHEPQRDLAGFRAVKHAGPALLTMPNVSFSGRRKNKVDREVEVGRWKVIEHELSRRGLPVFSSGKPDRRLTGQMA